MSKTRTIVIGLAIALASLGVVAPTPVYPAVPLVALTWHGPNVGGVVNVGDSVTLTATGLGAGPLPASGVRIEGRRLQTFWTILQTCQSLPCSVTVHSNVPGTFSFRADTGSLQSPNPSAVITVTWGAVGAEVTQLILEAVDVTVTVNLKWTAGGPIATASFIRGPGGKSPTTTRQKADRAISATARLNARLPDPWRLWVVVDPGSAGAGILGWAHCEDTQSCTAVIGPIPKSGPGYVPGSAVEARICRGTTYTGANCSTGANALAALNIPWEFP